MGSLQGRAILSACAGHVLLDATSILCLLLRKYHSPHPIARIDKQEEEEAVTKPHQIASFARDTLGMSYTTSLNLVIILNGVGIPARVLPGFIADRYIGVLNCFILALITNVITLWCWLAVSSIPAYYAWTVCYGLSSAAFPGLFPTTIAAYSTDINKTGTRLGMAFTVIGFSALVGGPISGALLQVGNGDYRVPIAWASSSTMVGTALCVVARCLKAGWKVGVRC
jgi:MFS family permease